MRNTTLSLGFIPLVDAAPYIVAQEMGFASQEGLTLDLKRAPSWSSLRDMLSFGKVDAAHMLAPIPVATALGLGNAGTALDAIMVTSINGNVIGVGKDLADQLAARGHDFAFDDATKAGRALLADQSTPLKIGTPFPLSMHALLLEYWLKALGLSAPPQVDIKTVPPALMADALAAKEVDAFCVGEPWGSVSVDQSHGSLLLPCSAIWQRAPEKVLAVRRNWAETEPDLAQRLIRAIWRACQWLSDPGSRLLTAELLARQAYLDRPTEVIDRALSGTFTVTPSGLQRRTPGFLEFHSGAANFPWHSQAQWIARQLATRLNLDPIKAAGAASAVFRTDIYRAALRRITPDLPGASSKLEGANATATTVASESGSLTLAPNRFFDGSIFDPSEPARLKNRQLS